ncbi:MAG: twin-arginine translocation signal domain-containing protein, partial [Terriglobales bacterium]
MSSATMKVDRREFLQSAAAGATGLVIGFYLPSRIEARAAAAEAVTFAPNAWVRIGTDDTVTLV